MFKFKNFVEILLLIATVSMISYHEITDRGTLSLESISYRYDLVFILAIVLALTKEVIDVLLRSKRIRFSQQVGHVFALVFLTFVSITIATALSFFVYNLEFNRIGFFSMAKFLFAIVLCLVVYRYLVDNGRFYRYLALAIYIPPLIPSVILLLFFVYPPFQSLVIDLSILGYDPYEERFIGFGSNPFEMATQSLVAISFLYPVALCNFDRRRPVIACLSILGIAILCLALFAAAVRTAFVIVLPLLVLETLLIGGLYHRYLRRLGVFAVVFLAAIPVILFVIPPELWEVVTSRLHEGDSRLFLWSYYIELAAGNPQGFGFNYEIMFGHPNPNPYTDRLLAPHNFLLEAWVLGGILGFVAVISFIALVVKRTMKQYKFTVTSKELPTYDKALYIGAITALCVYWGVGLFVALPFTELGHSLILAMVLAGPPRDRVQAVSNSVRSDTANPQPAEPRLPALP